MIKAHQVQDKGFHPDCTQNLRLLKLYMTVVEDNEAWEMMIKEHIHKPLTNKCKSNSNNTKAKTLVN